MTKPKARTGWIHLGSRRIRTTAVALLGSGLLFWSSWYTWSSHDTVGWPYTAYLSAAAAVAAFGVGLLLWANAHAGHDLRVRVIVGVSYLVGFLAHVLALKQPDAYLELVVGAGLALTIAMAGSQPIRL